MIAGRRRKEEEEEERDRETSLFSPKKETTTRFVFNDTTALQLNDVGCVLSGIVAV
jgi:hypothetical protein